MHLAAKEGFYSVCEDLISRGAIVNFNTTSADAYRVSKALSELTVQPLSLALENNHVKVGISLQIMEFVGMRSKKHIVACQRGGVSNKPPVLQAVTRHGPLTL